MSVTVRRRQGVPADPALERSARALGAGLIGGDVRRCEVWMTANRTRIVSMARRGSLLRVNVHWSVIGATDDLDALLRRRDPLARARILAAWRPGPRPAAPAITAGAHYDLAPLFLAENTARFNDRLALALGWGRRARRRRPPRSLRLGSYQDRPPRITIHPVLDHPSVPDFFLRFVLFHEMLHADLPPRITPSGRRVLHGPEFRRRERGHPDWERSARWERENLAMLLVRAAS